MPTWAYLLIAVLFSLVGIYYLILGIVNLKTYITHRDWLLTDAKIIFCRPEGLKEVLRVPSIKERMMNILGIISTALIGLVSNSTGKENLVVVTSYEYTILGQSYTNQERIRHESELTPGKAVKCMVNPTNLSESSFGKRTIFDLLNLILGLLMLGAAVGLFIAAI